MTGAVDVTPAIEKWNETGHWSFERVYGRPCCYIHFYGIKIKCEVTTGNEELRNIRSVALLGTEQESSPLRIA